MCYLHISWATPRYTLPPTAIGGYAEIVDSRGRPCALVLPLNPYCPVCDPLDWKMAAQKRWDQTLKAQKGRLGKYLDEVDLQLDHDLFDLYLKDLSQKHGSNSIMKALSPKVLESIKSFTAGITSITQGESYAAMAWGVVQCLLNVAYALRRVTDQIGDMLSNITNQLPIMEEYRDLFPDCEALNEPMRGLYDEYVGFCIDAVLFFKMRMWKVILKLAFGSLSRKFNERDANIASHSRTFMTHVDIVRTRLQMDTGRGVKRLISESDQTRVKGIPWEKNPQFYGRDEVLEDIHGNLRPKDDAQEKRQLSCVIHGIGGVGKTQLALEYTYRYRSHYKYIFWVRAEKRTDLATSFAKFADFLAVGKSGDDQGRIVELVRDWMAHNPSWLLVFDNVDQVSLDEYWPPSTHGSIMITTQKSALAYRATSDIQLSPFDEEDGSRMLIKLLNRRSKNDLSDNLRSQTRDVSIELGGLPLLLSHVAGFVDASNKPIGDLLQSLRQPSEFKAIWGGYDSTTSTNFQYGVPMNTVWTLALTALSNEARAALDILATLDPDGVLEDLLIGDWSDPELDFLHPSKHFDFDFVLQRLTDHNLVISTPVGKQRRLSIHRALKKYLLQCLEDRSHTKLQAVFWQSLKMVRRAFPKGNRLQTPTNKDWADCGRSLSHVNSLIALYQTWEPKIEPVFAFATLLLDTANYLWEKGLTKEGMDIMQVGEDVCVQLSNISEVIPIHANLCAIAGAVHAEIGFSGRAVAKQKCELALQLRQKRIRELEQSDRVTSDDAMLLANAWNDVGVVLIQNEEFEKAVPCLEESLRLKKQWESEDNIPWHFGETYKNLSFTHLSRGEFEKARELARRSYDLCSRGMAEKSAAAQKAKFILATILLKCGDIEKALTLHKQILLARQEIFGNAHGLTKDSLYNVGEIYRQQGDKLEKAEAKFREALVDCQAWPSEAIARAQHHLALVINEFTDRLTITRRREAEDLEEEARQLRERQDPSSVSNTPEENLRLHDFMVSLWAGRIGLVKKL